eukprot:gene8393-11351_t
MFSSKALFRKVPESILGRSEPDPRWFGNPVNESKNTKWTNPNWLLSRFHFSFAEYNNHRNMGFGVVRVMNDDLVQPKRGFGEHPHRNVEICTYVVEGKLSHQDSMGTQETLERGAIQFMTAGSGVTHSEHNLDADSPLRFIQIWIQTRKQGLKPNYGSMIGNVADRSNKWAHLVSDVDNKSIETPIKINQDANIFVTEVASFNSASFELQQGRQGYLLCIEGEAGVTLSSESNSQVLSRHDAAEVYGPNIFSVTPTNNNDNIHMLFIEMAYTGEGRTDI